LGVAGAVLYFFLFFFIPLLEAAGIHVGVPNAVPISWETIGALLLGFAGFVGGYMALPLMWVRRIPNVFRGAWDSSRGAWVVGGFALLGLIGKILRLAGGGYFHTERSALFREGVFASVAGYLDLAGVVALGVALLFYFSLKKEGNPAVWKFASHSLLALEFSYALFSCGRMATITVVFLYLITRWYAEEFSWKKALLVAIVAAAFIFPFGNACRNPLFFSNAGVSITSPSSLGAVGRVPALAGESMVTRLNQSFVFSHVYGRDLSDFRSDFPRDVLAALGPPSIFWKEKPISINARGNELGHRLSILGPDDRKTSVGPTLPGDFFINFGLLGVFLGMAFFGLLAKFFFAYLITPLSSLGGILAYSVLWPVFLHGFEGFIVPLFAGLVKLLILILVVHFMVQKRSSFL
ncbi:MAG: hypothetical protein Q8P88_00430, partial [Candidatus Jorgensenbacteria bacterium]|nr:hypothetical protein [Candidatus Jorgensenbacteria bacterium]